MQTKYNRRLLNPMDMIDALRLEGKEPTVTTLQTKIIVAVKDPDFYLNVSELARQVSVSRQNLYSWGRLAVTVLGIACLKTKPGPKPVEPERAEVSQLMDVIGQIIWQ